MRQALLISTAATAELVAAVVLPAPFSGAFAFVGLSTAAIAVAVGTRSPGLFHKRDDGSLPVWTWLPFWPWRVATLFAAWLIRSSFTHFTEVLPGWWVGVWPHKPDLFEEWPAVLDLTCELPRVHSAPHYLTTPTWDQTAPSLEAVEQGVAFLLEHREQGRPVLVHCAAGRGRSVTVLCAGLVAAGHAGSWREALALVQAARPQARLTVDQQAVLDVWSRARSA